MLHYNAAALQKASPLVLREASVGIQSYGGRISAVRIISDFIKACLHEWVGWLTGSLPMAVLAVAALIYPNIIPLPIWAWAILIFVAGYSVAAYRAYRSARMAQLTAEGKLANIAVQRPFVFKNVSVKATPKSNDGFTITVVTLSLENLSEHLIRYRFTRLSAHVNGIKLHVQQIPSRWIFAHGKRIKVYHMTAPKDAIFNFPVNIETEYEIEYDNVPEIRNRISFRRTNDLFTHPNQESINTTLDEDER
jgi:hypothetical protein